MRSTARIGQPRLRRRHLRAGASAPCSRAKTPTMASRRGAHGSAQRRRSARARRQVEERRQRRHAARPRRARTAAARRRCGMRRRGSSIAGQRRVGGAEIDPDEAAGPRLDRSDSRMFSSSFQRCCPVAGHAPQLERARLRSRGFRVSPAHFALRARPSASVTSSGPSSSRSSPAVLDQRRRRIVLADRGGEEPELRGLADGQTELAPGDRRARSPLPSRTARRTSAFSGAGMPGTAGIALSMPT